MEANMTDFQFRSLIKMVLKIIKKSGSIEEAAKELEELIRERAEE